MRITRRSKYAKAEFVWKGRVYTPQNHDSAFFESDELSVKASGDESEIIVTDGILPEVWVLK